MTNPLDVEVRSGEAPADKNRTGVSRCRAIHAFVLLSASIGILRGAEIVYAGSTVDTAGSWRTGSVTGSDGWYSFGANGSQKIPTYVASPLSPTVYAYPGNGAYASIDNPNTTPGSSPSKVISGTANPTPPVNQPFNILQFTLTGMVPARIRVGVMIDNLDFAIFNPSAIRVVQPGGPGDSGAVSVTGALYNNRNPDLLFFDITGGSPGDVVSVEAYGGGAGTATLALVSFDSYATASAGETIVYAGSTLDTAGSWRTGSVTGSDGWYSFGANGSQRIPTYVASPFSPTVYVYPGNGAYASIDNPNTTPGSSPSKIILGTANPTSGVNQPFNIFQFTLTGTVPARVRVGVMIDNLDLAIFNPSAIRVVQSGGPGDSGAVSVTAASYNNRNPDLLFFDITGGSPGDVVSVEAYGGGTGIATLALVSFDSYATSPANTILFIPATTPVSSGGGMGAFLLTANGTWTLTSNAPWLAINPSSGPSGSFQNVAFTAMPNVGIARTGQISGGGAVFTVSQPAGAQQLAGKEYIRLNSRVIAVENSSGTSGFFVSPNSETLNGTGGLSAFTVNASPGLAWTVAASVGITLQTVNGTGTGAVTYTAAANNSTTESTFGTITVTATDGSSAAFGVTVAPGQVTMSPSGTVTVSGGQPQTFTAGQSVTWSLLGAGSLSATTPTATVYTAPAATASAQTATVMAIAGPGNSASTSVTVPAQASGSSQYLTLSTNSASVSAGGTGLTQVSVASGGGLLWTAQSDQSWLSVTPTSGGSSSGPFSTAISYSATSQAAQAPSRTGHLTFSPSNNPAVPTQILTVTQAAASKFTISVPPVSFLSDQNISLNITVTQDGTSPPYPVTFSILVTGYGNQIPSFPSVPTLTGSGTIVANSGPASAGTYTATVTASASVPGTNGTTTYSTTTSITIADPPSIIVTPAGLNIYSNSSSQQFTATTRGSLSSITWSVIPLAPSTCPGPIGSVNSQGVYTPPVSVPACMVMVVATASNGTYGGAVVNFTPNSSPEIDFSPNTITMTPVSRPYQFTPIVYGLTSNAVTYRLISASSAFPAGSNLGSISSTGLYSPPPSVPTSGAVSLIATSIVSGPVGPVSGAATIMLTPTPPETITFTPGTLTFVYPDTFTASLTGPSPTFQCQWLLQIPFPLFTSSYPVYPTGQVTPQFSPGGGTCAAPFYSLSGNAAYLNARFERILLTGTTNDGGFSDQVTADSLPFGSDTVFMKPSIVGALSDQMYTIQVADTGGFGGSSEVDIAFGDPQDVGSTGGAAGHGVGCYVRYVVALNYFELYDDLGQGMVTDQNGNITAYSGSSSVLSNSRCTLNASLASLTFSNSNRYLTIQLPVHLNTSLVGQQCAHSAGFGCPDFTWTNIYVSTPSDMANGWRALGAWAR